jgi:hypothetical protein
MKQQRLYRFILALLVVAFSSASAVHEVLHHDALRTTSHITTAPSQNSGHSNGCEFCAKGPTASIEATTIGLDYFSRPEIIAPDESFVSIPKAVIHLLTLRGPPIA